jgi:hypothetical protein
MLPLQRNGHFWYGGQWLTAAEYTKAVARPRYTRERQAQIVESEIVNQSAKEIRNALRKMNPEPPPSSVRIELFARGARRVEPGKSPRSYRVLSDTWYGHVLDNHTPRKKTPGLVTIREDDLRFRLEIVYDGTIQGTLQNRPGTKHTIQLEVHRVEQGGPNNFAVYATVDRKDLSRIKRMKKGASG